MFRTVRKISPPNTDVKHVGFRTSDTWSGVGLRGPGQPGSFPNCQPIGARRRHGSSRKHWCWETQVVHTRNNLSENYPQFEPAPSEMFAGPVLGGKGFEECNFKGPKLLACLGRPRVSERPRLYISRGCITLDAC